MRLRISSTARLVSSSRHACRDRTASGSHQGFCLRRSLKRLPWLEDTVSPLPLLDSERSACLQERIIQHLPPTGCVSKPISNGVLDKGGCAGRVAASDERLDFRRLIPGNCDREFDGGC